MTAAADVLRAVQPPVEEDEQLLLRFVVWNLRVRDLPPAVRDAAARVAATRQHPRIDASDAYVDAPYRVSGIAPDEDAPPVAIAADRANVAEAVNELLIARPLYVVVTHLEAVV